MLRRRNSTLGTPSSWKPTGTDSESNSPVFREEVVTRNVAEKLLQAGARRFALLHVETSDLASDLEKSGWVSAKKYPF